MRIFIVALLFFSFGLCAQDTSRVSRFVTTTDSSASNCSRNQVWMQLFGNNFVTWTGYSYNRINYVEPFTLGYSRRFVTRNNNCFITSIGIGVFSYDATEAFSSIEGLGIPFQVLWRKNYKRNGVWCGISMQLALGRQYYSSYNTTGYVFHRTRFSYAVNPEISYQFQSKNESYFIRFSYTPKILVSGKVGGTLFTPNQNLQFHPLYGGMSFGYGFDRKEKNTKPIDNPEAAEEKRHHNIFLEVHGHNYFRYSNGRPVASINYGYSFKFNPELGVLTSAGIGFFTEEFYTQVPYQQPVKHRTIVTTIPLDASLQVGAAHHIFELGGGVVLAYGDHKVRYVVSSSSRRDVTLSNGIQYVARFGYAYRGDMGLILRVAMTPHFYSLAFPGFQHYGIDKKAWIPIGISIGHSFWNYTW